MHEQELKVRDAVLKAIEENHEKLGDPSKKHKVSMKVVSLRQWNTRRGVGYEAKVEGSDGEEYGSIWNDGDGGATYFDVNHESGKTWKDFSDYSEWDLGDLIVDWDISEYIERVAKHFDVETKYIYELIDATE
jgi:hypothetical protein|tara:strand:- start:18 stop:416 length:399 start_codon:yes stop_codon:yes gene_type:complete